jgi:hypothetical protein
MYGEPVTGLYNEIIKSSRIVEKTPTLSHLSEGLAADDNKMPNHFLVLNDEVLSK